jgi:hypothetical protein
MKAKKKFSSFNWNEAFITVGIERLKDWRVDFLPVVPTEFFKERLRRLENFGLTNSERGKELIIDAVCEEAIDRHPGLRIWKAAPLESDTLTGTVDYIVAPRRDYVATPLLCVVEAKKDDFEKGLAQCLVEMKACQWRNQNDGKSLTVYGVVTNGNGWQFYQLTLGGEVYESPFYALNQIQEVLGMLGYIFTECEQVLSSL